MEVLFVKLGKADGLTLRRLDQPVVIFTFNSFHCNLRAFCSN